MVEDTESFSTNIAPSTPSTIPVHWPTSKGDTFLSPSEYLIVVWQELSRPFPSSAKALPLASVPMIAVAPIHAFIISSYRRVRELIASDGPVPPQGCL
jgi:hypothetical protein